MSAERATWLGKVRKQAQVFASAWSLVGSRFDQGGELENAEHQREELMRLVIDGPSESAALDAMAQRIKQAQAISALRGCQDVLMRALEHGLTDEIRAAAQEALTWTGYGQPEPDSNGR